MKVELTKEAIEYGFNFSHFSKNKERDRAICEMRMGGMTYEEIGREFNLSKDRCRVICERVCRAYASAEDLRRKENDMARQHHYLKTLPKYFLPVERGVKNFEVRFNDRGYAVGDMLHLQEFADGEFTGREITKEICYILDSAEYCKEGFVVLGLKGECYGTIY